MPPPGLRGFCSAWQALWIAPCTDEKTKAQRCEVTCVSQPAGEWRGWDLNSASPTPEPDPPPLPLGCPPVRTVGRLRPEEPRKYSTNIHSLISTPVHGAATWNFAVVPDSVMSCSCVHFTDEKTKVKSSCIMSQIHTIRKWQKGVELESDTRAHANLEEGRQFLRCPFYVTTKYMWEGKRRHETAWMADQAGGETESKAYVMLWDFLLDGKAVHY